jgi:hypothetical protein
MGHPIAVLKGLGLGAGLMYFFDPRAGRSRRALLGDQLTGLLNDMSDAVCDGACDLGNRARGLAAEARALFGGDEAPDQVIVERVRAELGRVVSHPRAIGVSADRGRVILSGPVLAPEVDRLLATVAAVRGVKGVGSRLDIREHAGDISALQGGNRRTGEQPELWQRTWSPSARLMLGAAGGAMLLPLVARARLSTVALVGLGFGMALTEMSRSHSGRPEHPRRGRDAGAPEHLPVPVPATG